MDFLGVGFAELIFILIIAMMVFGPRRLPEIAAKAGKIVADLRGMSQGLLTEWQREINAEAYMEELRKTKNELNAVKKELTLAGSTITRETSDVAKQIASPDLSGEAQATTKATAEEPPAAAESQPAPEVETGAEASNKTVSGAETEAGVVVGPQAELEAEAEAGTGTGPDVEPEADLTAESGPKVETKAEPGSIAGTNTTEVETGVVEEEAPEPERSSPTPVSVSSNSKARSPSISNNDSVTGTQSRKSEPGVNE